MNEQTPAAYNALIDAFRQARVLVVGDVMLDRYIWGRVTRISPEAPVPVVAKVRETQAAGGAANVALNVLSLGGQAELAAVLGSDASGEALREILQQSGLPTGGLFTEAGRRSTVKTRIIAHSQHVVRLDEESTEKTLPGTEQSLLDHVQEKLAECNVVVLSDYAKGVLTDTLVQGIIRLCRAASKPVVVDPKGVHYDRYAGASVVTPNRSEAAKALGLDGPGAQSTESLGIRLLDALPVDALLITEGEAGMTLFERGKPPVHVASIARHVYDVSGAGDTVIAAMSLTLSVGGDLLAAATLGNTAAGVGVEQMGTTAVTAAMLRDAVEKRAAAFRPSGR
ncbi:MAG: D-glycero-beta-D-manno-heptose-7-phosphate kinase [Bryobacteraceae bacterium]|nr:D-glycero-beta-D-manno-heptose-7-phosphate kinase [Bryobacteraceae bacterium]